MKVTTIKTHPFKAALEFAALEVATKQTELELAKKRFELLSSIVGEEKEKEKPSKVGEETRQKLALAAKKSWQFRKGVGLSQKEETIRFILTLCQGKRMRKRHIVQHVKEKGLAFTPSYLRDSRIKKVKFGMYTA